MGSCGAHIRSPIWRFGACSGRLAIPTLSTNRMGQHSTRFFQLMTTSTASRPGYAFGLLFICPLIGDLVRRRPLICLPIFLVASLMSSASPSPQNSLSSDCCLSSTAYSLSFRKSSTLSPSTSPHPRRGITSQGAVHPLGRAVSVASGLLDREYKDDLTYSNILRTMRK